MHKLSRRTVIGGLATLGGVSISGGILWWVIAPHPLSTYYGHSGIVNTLAWSPEGKRIASGGPDNTVQVWDATDGAHVYIYHYNTVRTLAWSPEGKRIALGGNEHTVQIWKAS